MRELILLLLFLLSSCVGTDVVTVEKGVAANLNSSEGLSVTFSDTMLSQSSYKTITLSHSGKLDLFDIEVVALDEESPFQFVGESGYPGDGGTCGEVLKKNQSCTIELSFTPETERTWSDKLIIKYNDGIAPTQKTIALKGYGGNVAKLEVDSESIELGLTEPGGVLRSTVTIYNRGGLDAINLDLALSGSSYFEIENSSCKAIIKKGSSCAFDIVYAPEDLATHMAELQVTYENPETLKEFAISFIGYSVSIEAELRIMGTGTYDFGSAPVGKELTKKFTISNAGYLDGYDISAVDVGPYKLKSSNCPVRLAPKESCQVELSFTPIIIGDDDRTFGITYNSGKSVRTVSIDLKGKGVAPATLMYTAISPYNFGIKGLGDSVDLTIMFANSGSYDATDVVITTSGAPFNVIINTCLTEMYPGYSCMIKVRYTPTSVGIFHDQIRLDYFDGGQNQFLIFEMQAEARMIGVLKTDQSLYDFGNIVVNDVVSKTVTITNVGQGAVASIIPVGALDLPFVFKGGAFPGTGGTCGGALTPSDTCTVIIEASSASTTSRLTTMTLSFDNGDFTEDLEADLSVSINKPAIIALPANYDFMGISVGKTVGQTFFLSNSGERTARVTSLRLIDGTNYSLNDGGCVNAIIAPTENCEIALYSTAPGYVVYTDTLELMYDDGNDQIVTVLMNITSEGMNLGNLVVGTCVRDYVFPNTAKNGTKTTTCTLSNNGQAALTGLVIPTFTAPFSMLNNTCTGTLNPAQSCTFDLRFSPTDYGEFAHQSPDNDPFYTYNNGQRVTTLQFWRYSGSGVTAANVAFLGSNNYDFGYVVVNTNKDRVLTVYNTGGVTATGLSFSVPPAPYTIASNDCGATLDAGTFCTVTLRYSPTVVAVQHNGTLVITYNNGVAGGQTYTLTYKGVGEPPISTHRGWDEIYSVGANVNQYNIDQGGQMVRLKWPAMTPSTADPITSYTVYRRLSSDADFDYNSPIASGISTATRTFTDTTVVSGQLYYYQVKPIILNYPGRTIETFSTVRVLVPPANMALGHRWMINKEVCETAGLSPIKTQNYQCNYAGFGNSAGKFDIGYDLVMDRYELGANYENSIGQYPLENLSQPAAWDACEDSDPVVVAGFSGTFTKYLPSRREYTIMGQWPATLSDATIVAKESAIRASTDCNGNATESEQTGNNTGCVSRYGVMDIPGNAFEWASDRILNGIGLEETSLKLNPNNNDIDGIDFSDMLNGTVASNTYFSRVLGMPLPESAQSYEQVLNITATKLHDNYLYAPFDVGMKIPLVGGSYLTVTHSGLYSTAWVSTSYVGGARCMFKAAY